MSTVSAVAIENSAPENASNLTSRKLSGTALSALLARTLGPASSFLLALLLARALGAKGSGTFFVSLTLVTAGAIFAKFGLETALQRFVGAASGRGEISVVAGIYRQALWICSVLSVAISALCIGFAGPVAELLFHDLSQAGLIRLLAIAIVPFSLLGIHAAMLKAIGKPAWGGFFEAAAWPTLTVSLAAITLLYRPLTADTMAAAYLLAGVLATAFGYAVLKRSLPGVTPARPIAARQLCASCLPLTGIEVINYALLWAPFLLLPMLSDSSEAGLYNVCHRLAAQLGLLMIVFASITAPRFAAHSQQGDNAALAKLAGQSTRTMLLFGLPPAILLLVWSEQILGLFGSEFSAAAQTLRILVFAQLINLATGPVGYLLAMTGYERLLRNVLIATALISICLSLLLIPAYGAAGAAWSVALPMIIHNLACCLLAARRLNLPFILLFSR
ncbi:MAG: polysaccharide biosynthesis C-terminal domain-containing protein [Gammaproteobacteria bacterium]